MRAVLVGMAFFLVCPAHGAEPDVDTSAITVLLRNLLLANMPTHLVENRSHWGKQKEVTVGMSLQRERPLQWQAVPRKAIRNDGHWYAVTVLAKNPQQTLALGIKNLQTIEPGKSTLELHAGMDVDLKFEQQVWKAGTRLYSGETRGRCRIALLLKLEANSRIERKPQELLPSASVRLRASEAQLFYDQLVIEHTLGVGGDAAKMLGEAGHKLMNRVKPSLERDLLAKANAAIVRAADTKDLQVGIDKLLLPAKSRTGAEKD